jgi:hypothetical protein
VVANNFNGCGGFRRPRFVRFNQQKFLPKTNRLYFSLFHSTLYLTDPLSKMLRCWRKYIRNAFVNISIR